MTGGRRHMTARLAPAVASVSTREAQDVERPSRGHSSVALGAIRHRPLARYPLWRRWQAWIFGSSSAWSMASPFDRCLQPKTAHGAAMQADCLVFAKDAAVP